MKNRLMLLTLLIAMTACKTQDGALDCCIIQDKEIRYNTNVLNVQGIELDSVEFFIITNKKHIFGNDILPVKYRVTDYMYQTFKKGDTLKTFTNKHF